MGIKRSAKKQTKSLNAYKKSEYFTKDESFDSLKNV